ncbi:MAG: hypothetical protein WC223_05495 [Bacteroidales bacterium]|jgi:hypothetical protein
MKKNLTKSKVNLIETMLEENASFDIVGEGSYEGKLENGVLVPNEESIIINNEPEINGKIPGIKNIWLTTNDIASNNFTIHVKGACPDCKENNYLEFYDDNWNIYKMKIYSHVEEQVHTLHFNSNNGNIIKITWDI